MALFPRVQHRMALCHSSVRPVGCPRVRTVHLSTGVPEGAVLFVCAPDCGVPDGAALLPPDCWVSVGVWVDDETGCHWMA